ncbi:MAG: ribbon-helix-helix protein, CopG family [Sulfolobales archaeon]|nr:ribbon-helix-helix protein, CopG family [Sulfolobales archaeon]MCX8208816.1 ribbon-helix-helix protein, CopG family [Sulfolobales archaeon]MDW8011007.1 ribbon-helix-helix protein, CopG family [Sulfolobales archaeon]
MRIVTFKLNEETLLKLNQVADELGISRSEVIREAISSYINKRFERNVKLKRVLLK